MIRTFRPTDREALLAITALAFDGVSIDQNIEARYGLIQGVAWQQRKARHIEADIQANPNGIFVFESEGRVVGYITCRVELRAGIGAIPNLAVHPDHQGRGIGKQLIEAALAYLKSLGLKFARIETLEQNRRGAGFYPRMGFREIAWQIHYIRPLDDPSPPSPSPPSSPSP